MNIASGFALLAIATIVSDVLLLYVLPHRREYKAAKFVPILETINEEGKPIFATMENGYIQNIKRHNSDSDHDEADHPEDDSVEDIEAQRKSLITTEKVLPSSGYDSINNAGSESFGEQV